MTMELKSRGGTNSGPSGLPLSSSGFMSSGVMDVPLARGRGGFLAQDEGRLDEFVEVAVEDAVGVARLHARAQVLDHPVGVENVGADLVPPCDVGLGVLELLQLLVLLHLLDLVVARR